MKGENDPNIQIETGQTRYKDKVRVKYRRNHNYNSFMKNK